MKKIMFNDRYGLTAAVINGNKTMTRRIIPQLMSDKDFDISEWGINDQGKAHICLYEGGRPTTDIFPAYQPGEVVAVAQSYKALGYTKKWVEQHISPNPHARPTDPFEKKYPGWNNKMFTHSELEKVRKIEITNIKVERLQDISDEDCLREGIVYDEPFPELADPNVYAFPVHGKKRSSTWWNPTPKIAFENLIRHMMGKKVWDENPWVFAYSFELLKTH